MEKNRIHQIESGKNTRMSFAGQRNVLEMPNLIEVQTTSYEWFLKEGLAEVFRDISPIKDSFTNNQLIFESFELQRDKAKYTIEECKERDATYSAPISAKVKLIRGSNGEAIEDVVFMGDLPLMTDTGSFIINGAERVIVSQIVRSPGIYYKVEHDKSGKKIFSNQTIPIRGAWLEYETDSNDNIFVHVDRNNKVSATALIHAFGYTDADIERFYGDDPKIKATLARERADIRKPDGYDPETEALETLYKKIRPGEPFVKESAKTLIENMLFDPKRYDLGRVGRYKFNKKMNLMYRLKGQILAEDAIDENTGEILAEAGKVLTVEDGRRIQNSGIESVVVTVDDGKNSDHKVIVMSNQMVEADEYLAEFGLTPKEAGIRENASYPVLMNLLDSARAENYTKEETAELLRDNLRDLVPTHITVREILTSIGYLLNLEYGIGKTDDIDHLSNRRIRAVGELLQNQYRIGMSRMERVVHERMTTMESDQIELRKLINIKPITAAVKEFFGSSQLSQFMDQNNPLSELTHKRRLSALGPGGLSRERAGFEVRDVHYTHYGRMCPVETPEGSNIGLINSLASYARINEYGFIEAPYRKVDHSGDKPVVTDEVIYLAADEEDDFHVAQANTPLDEKGHFVNDAISGRFREETKNYPADKIDLMDVSPKMVFSVATSMIPFLEHDDANRALMGSNMQRQAVPLMLTESPVVDTGLADKVAKDSGVCVVCKEAGTVLEAAADRIVVKTEAGEEQVYKLKKFERSNQSNSYNQKPIVVKGEKVEAGQIIADGPSTHNGEIALGRNPLIGFMTWEGYNYEDAVLLSERLVQDDVFTSIHIEEYEVEARETKLGPEEITRDVPGVGDEALKELDENGIIRIGAEVRAGDILVGKVTPKGETEMSPEEKLLRAIFDEKAREVRDTSLRLPHGAYGTIIDAKVFTRANNAELAPGVTKSVRVYVAQKRKISVGDKMAGRHGNKGVVSRVLPVEDMPYLPNGRPLDIVLNPLGVPSRMNIGQVLEIHLSLAAKALGFDVSTPVFDGASEKEIGDLLEIANDYVNSDFDDFKKKYKNSLSEDAMTYLGEHLENRALWEGVPISRDGKVQLRDGRTGEPFDSPTTIGHMHYLKLHHLVDDKIHARSTGPYSLVTQQPLGGKAQFGGQRFGEMEVWALEAYGASYTLQEILTVKSDDIVGRVRTYEAIVKGENIPNAGVPESFKVLVKELQSLALDVKILDENNEVVKISECSEYGNTNINALLNDDERRSAREKEYRDAGNFSIQYANAKGEWEEVPESTGASDDVDGADDYSEEE